MRPTAKSLVLDLLSTLRAGSMPVRALVGAGELFSIDGNAMRVAIARLVAEGVVERDERGAYRLGSAAASISTHVTSWRSIEERVRAWDGRWIGALTSSLPRSQRPRIRASERALRFLGFRVFERGLVIRPDNLKGGVDAVRERLADLGLDPDVAVFGLYALDGEREAHARALWQNEDLDGNYRKLLETLERSTARLTGLSARRAMAESFLVGGATIRAIVLDPLLPEPMAAVELRHALVAALREYDRLGRRYWAAFMNEHGAPYLRAPHDVRTLDAAWAASRTASGAST
jgi:phenylacetic acid degradation operon negative regulatory protein